MLLLATLISCAFASDIYVPVVGGKNDQAVVTISVEFWGQTHWAYADYNETMDFVYNNSYAGVYYFESSVSPAPGHNIRVTIKACDKGMPGMCDDEKVREFTYQSGTPFWMPVQYLPGPVPDDPPAGN